MVRLIEGDKMGWLERLYWEIDYAFLSASSEELGCGCLSLIAVVCLIYIFSHLDVLVGFF